MSPKTKEPRHPRVEIAPDLYRALCAEAILQDTTPKDLVTMWIMDNLSPKTREFITPEDHSPMIPTPQKPKQESKASINADIPQQPQKKKGRLADNLDAIAKIKEMWNSGNRNGAEIARQIRYPKATVNENIKKLKNKGELQE